MQHSARLFIPLLFALTAASLRGNIITSANDPALVAAHLIDFNAVPTGGFWGAIALDGTAFKGDNALNISPWGSDYGLDADVLTNQAGFLLPSQQMTITMPIAVPAFGMLLYCPDGCSMNVRDGSDQFIELINIAPTSFRQTVFYGSKQTDATIKAVSLSWGQSVNGFPGTVMVDNFQYAAGASSVPEPTYAGLLFSLLSSALLFRRRTR